MESNNASPGSSINDYKTEHSMHYSSVDDAIQLLSAWERGALMAKVDLKSAFRMVSVRHQDWELLGIYWRDLYYVDTCLPFGCRSAPFLFNQFANAIHWINLPMPFIGSICQCHSLDPGRELSGQLKPLPG